MYWKSISQYLATEDLVEGLVEPEAESFWVEGPSSLCILLFMKKGVRDIRAIKSTIKAIIEGVTEAWFLQKYL